MRLGGRAPDLLIVLVERAGEVVPNRALLEAVWRDVNVEESSLRFHIKNPRKALGDSHQTYRAAAIALLPKWTGPTDLDRPGRRLA